MEPKLERARLWLGLAQEKLEVARELLDLNRFDDVISKAYYVMFYATRAALATRGIELRRHSGAIALLGQEFVRDNQLDVHYVRLLTRAMQAREISDYDPSVRATRQDAEAAVTNAAKFLVAVTEMLGDSLSPPDQM